MAFYLIIVIFIDIELSYCPAGLVDQSWLQLVLLAGGLLRMVFFPALPMDEVFRRVEAGYRAKSLRCNLTEGPSSSAQEMLALPVALVPIAKRDLPVCAEAGDVKIVAAEALLGRSWPEGKQPIPVERVPGDKTMFEGLWNVGGLYHV